MASKLARSLDATQNIGGLEYFSTCVYEIKNNEAQTSRFCQDCLDFQLRGPSSDKSLLGC